MHLQVVRARVPLIAFVDSQTGIMVDISVSNHGGAFKSIFTRELSQFDPRFVALYRLVSSCSCAAHVAAAIGAVASIRHHRLCPSPHSLLSMICGSTAAVAGRPCLTCPGNRLLSHMQGTQGDGTKQPLSLVCLVCWCGVAVGTPR